MGSSSFFNNPPVGDVIDEGGQGNSFYDSSPAYTQIDQVAVEHFRDEAEAAAAASEASHQASQTSANASDASATASHTSELNAAASAAGALASKNSADTDATTATSQAGIATTQAGIATTQAGNAATSASQALASKNAAATSETNAGTSASQALSSKNAAATSETNAGTSATNAANSASAAATSASNAASAVQAAAGTATPSAPGTAAVGTGTKWAHEDHVHPTDTTRAAVTAVRDKLTSDRIYYVRTNGSDSNGGLSNTAGGAFLTIQKALDTVAGLDINTRNVTINVADGTYTGTNTVSGPWLGSGNVTIVGNTTTPANVIINPASGACFQATGGAFFLLSGMELRGQFGILSQRGSRVYGQAGLRFGVASAYHAYANGGQIILFNDYAIVGAASVHALVDAGGALSATGITVTITGTPAFGSFANAGGVGSSLLYYSNTFVGSATGTRFVTQQGALINSNGGGANYFPGNAAGSGTNFGASPWGLYQ